MDLAAAAAFLQFCFVIAQLLKDKFSKRKFFVKLYFSSSCHFSLLI